MQDLRTVAATPAMQNPGWFGKLIAVLQGDALIGGITALGIIIGFVHGWLKLRYASPIVTFLFDLVLLLALGLAYVRKPAREPFFPRGRLGTALMAFYAVCVFYAVVPFGPPLLLSVAALRGWCFATLMYGLGYNVTRTVTQVKAYFYLLVILGVLTGLYGVRQSPEEVALKMSQDDYFAARLQGTYYGVQGGQAQLRKFSTFVTAGVFGSVMAYVICFTLILLTEDKVGRTEQALLAAAMLPMAYGMILSGSRSPLITMFIGLAVIIWYRRRITKLVAMPIVLYFAYKWGVAYTGGAATERFGTLLDTGTVTGRLMMPVLSAWYDFQANPLGGGLGRSGYSVPFILASKVHYTGIIPGEGDLPCLIIEMGTLGLVLFINLLYCALRDVYQALKELRQTSLSTIALASAVCVVLAVVAFPIGSPFLSIPTGALTWFFLGTLQKLADQYRNHAFGSELPPPTPALPQKRFLHRTGSGLSQGTKRVPKQL